MKEYQWYTVQTNLLIAEDPYRIHIKGIYNYLLNTFTNNNLAIIEILYCVHIMK